jgi:hypothetical protein
MKKMNNGKLLVYKRIQPEIFSFVTKMNRNNVAEADMMIKREIGGFEVVEAKKTGKKKFSIKRTNQMGNTFEFDLHVNVNGVATPPNSDFRCPMGYIPEKDIDKFFSDEDYRLEHMAILWLSSKFEMIMDKPILNHLRRFSNR